MFDNQRITRFLFKGKGCLKEKVNYSAHSTAISSNFNTIQLKSLNHIEISVQSL